VTFTILNIILSPSKLVIYETSFVSFIENAFDYLATMSVFFYAPPFLCYFLFLLLHISDMFRCFTLLRRRSRERERERENNVLYQDGASLKLSLFNRVARTEAARCILFISSISSRAKGEKNSTLHNCAFIHI